MNEYANPEDSAAQFKATLELLVPLIIQEIINSRRVALKEAFELFYGSRVYAVLEDEETKLWHLSPLTLANLLNEELETGDIMFPHEA
jgi:hypothetical protein